MVLRIAVGKALLTRRRQALIGAFSVIVKTDGLFAAHRASRDYEYYQLEHP